MSSRCDLLRSGERPMSTTAEQGINVIAEQGISQTAEQGGRELVLTTRQSSLLFKIEGRR